MCLGAHGGSDCARVLGRHVAVRHRLVFDVVSGAHKCSRVEFGDDFDQYSYGELCKLINGKSKELFY